MYPYNRELKELAERRVIEKQKLTSEQVEMIKLFEIKREIELDNIKKEIRQREEKYPKLTFWSSLFR